MAGLAQLIMLATFYKCAPGVMHCGFVADRIPRQFDFYVQQRIACNPDATARDLHNFLFTRLQPEPCAQ